ncbi:hypothetical protein [Nostoc sp. ChiQUE01b]|nr:hypothetical protein [Nostoc sp. ChiQUE01b]MDZ8261892.1 hypothetical protein [Nostoc sp. ChiQUE01b]
MLVAETFDNTEFLLSTQYSARAKRTASANSTLLYLEHPGDLSR